MELRQMGTRGSEEIVAYSVQDLGGQLWRWRVYRAGGQVFSQGVEISKALAERVAAALAFGGVDVLSQAV
jgi:hypothetical protein